MNRISKIKLFCVSLAIIFAVSILFLSNFNLKLDIRENYCVNHEINNNDNDNLKISQFSAPIYIDNNDPSSNWTTAKKAGICTGNGTSSDPYVIQDLVIEGNSSVSCILIEDSNVYFRIENCTLFNSGSYYSYAGIKLVRVSNGILINNNVSNNNEYGIYLDHSDYNMISGNIIINNDDDGLYLYYSDENDILGNTFTYNSNGLFLDHSHYNDITGNIINNNRMDGIRSPWYYDSNFNRVIGNTVNDNGGNGMELSFSSYCTVSVNDANRNGNFGINMNGYDNLVSGNTANDNNYGIRLDRCYNSEVSGNTVNFNTHAGIWVSEGSNNVVSENEVINNDGNGISVSSYDMLISGNTVNYNKIGIYLMESDSTDILGNTVSQSDEYGIHVINSISISIELNILNNNPVAIYLYKSEADLSNNIFNANDVDLKEYTEPPFPYAAVITGTLIVIGLLIGSLLIVRRKNIKARTRFQLPEKPITEGDLEAESKLDTAIQELEEEETIHDELEVEISIEQLRSKYKYEIEKVREKVHNQNYFINLRGIDQIIMQFEKLELKDRPYSQDPYLEKLLDYAITYCKMDNDVLINEIHIQKALRATRRIEDELIREIKSIEEFGVKELEEQPVEVKALQEEEIIDESKVAQDELGQQLNIEQVRSRFSKYKKEIEKIRDKFHSQNIFINLKGVNEVINSIEKLNLKKREAFLDEYLEKLLNYAIIFCKNVNENLVNESHIKMAFQEIYRTEVDLMRKIESIEEISEIRPEAQLDELQQVEEEKVSTPEELPLKEEVIEEEVAVSAPEEQIDELPLEEQIQIKEEVEETEPQEPPEEIIQPEPQITNCPFCGFVFDETPTFCPQCGMTFKK